MKFKRLLSLFTVATITAAPLAAVISCGSEATPLNLDQAIVANATEKNPFKLNELPFNDGKALFSKSVLEKFQKKLLKDLYYGPEAWDLKSITLDTGKITSGSQLGVYYPASKQIFINISDLETVDEDDSFDVIEKVIAHEYGHHFFATYANGYRSKDSNNIDPAVKNDNVYVYDNMGNKKYVSAWNKDYFDSFVNSYNMFDTSKYTGSTIGKVKYINSVFSLKDLFDNSNKKNADPLKFPLNQTGDGYEKVTFASGYEPSGDNWTPAKYAVSVDSSNASTLKYIYSMDEQVTRKMQMLFYPKKIEAGRFSFDASLMKASSGESTFFDPYVVDWMRSADLYANFNTGEVAKAKIYDDDIFTNGNSVEKAYDALLKLMGYGKQISHMYSRNTAEVSTPSTVVNLKKSNDNHVKVSGYIDPSKGYKYIVDNKGNKIADLDVSKDLKDRFNFNHKAKWNSKSADVGPSNFLSKVPYISSEFNVENLNGKELYFAKELGSENNAPITEINTSDGHTNVNSYDSQRPYDDIYYKLNFDGKTAKVGVYK